MRRWEDYYSAMEKQGTGICLDELEKELLNWGCRKAEGEIYLTHRNADLDTEGAHIIELDLQGTDEEEVGFSVFFQLTVEYPEDATEGDWEYIINVVTGEGLSIDDRDTEALYVYEIDYGAVAWMYDDREELDFQSTARAVLDGAEEVLRPYIAKAISVRKQIEGIK